MKRRVVLYGLVGLLSLITLTLCPKQALACGGFFCQAVPINQAAEQIVFRQDGNDVTAVVLIQYVGEAEDFSWVVPVPGIPELSTGSDLFFQSLELATRPQFNLDIEGQGCTDGANIFDFILGGPLADSLSEEDSGDDGVEVLAEGAVGPFDTQVVSSDDPDAMAQWLEDNDYDLSDRGRDLIAPYVEEGMNFVALKLQQDQGVGDIRPLIMKYQTENPMVPIKLTAVAAQDDMGVLVWVVGSSRAVPLNYPHVDVNYTLLNWYAGSTNGYVSYQGLVTAAMNEVGGQGFATDYAGRFPDLLDQLPSADDQRSELEELQAIPEVNDFYDALSLSFVLPSNDIQDLLRRELPLPEGIDEFVYFSGDALDDVFDEETLQQARTNIEAAIETEIIEPLQNSLDTLDGDPYITRLYTTLSADEMTLDPTFSFNDGTLSDQQLDRNATLSLSCNLGNTSWTLTLGSGTGRDGELVIEGTGQAPVGAPSLDQASFSKSEWLSQQGAAELITKNDFSVAQVDNEEGTTTLGLCGTGSGACGAVSMTFLLIGWVGLRRMRVRR